MVGGFCTLVMVEGEEREGEVAGAGLVEAVGGGSEALEREKSWGGLSGVRCSGWVGLVEDVEDCVFDGLADTGRALAVDGFPRCRCSFGASAGPFRVWVDILQESYLTNCLCVSGPTFVVA